MLAVKGAVNAEVRFNTRLIVTLRNVLRRRHRPHLRPRVKLRCELRELRELSVGSRSGMDV